MIRKILGTSGSRLLNAVAALVLLFIATNELGKEAWGLAGIILLDVSLMLLVVELLAGSGLVYYATRSKLPTLMLVSYSWTVVVVAFFALVFWLLSFFPEVYQSIIPNGYGVHILALVLINSFHGFNMNILLGKGQINRFNSLFVMQFTVQLFAMALLVYVFALRDERAFVYALYVSYSIPALVGLRFVVPMLKGEKLSPWTETFKSMFRFGSMTQLSSIAHMMNKRLSFYIIKAFTGIGAVGIYTSGVQITEGLRLIGQSISLVQFSSISSTNDHDYAAKLSLTLLKLSVFVTALGPAILLLLPKTLFEFIFTKDFGDIKLVVASLAVGVVALAANTIFSHYFSGTGKPRYNLYASLIGLGVTLPTAFTLIPWLGLAGAGISASLSYSAAACYQWIVFSRLSKTTFVQLFPSKTDLRLLQNVFHRSKES